MWQDRTEKSMPCRRYKEKEGTGRKEGAPAAVDIAVRENRRYNY